VATYGVDVARHRNARRVLSLGTLEFRSDEASHDVRDAAIERNA
jgi:hypothetical protein